MKVRTLWWMFDGVILLLMGSVATTLAYPGALGAAFRSAPQSPGKDLSPFKGVTLAASGQTMIVVLDSACEYCSESAVALRELADDRKAYGALARLQVVGVEPLGSLVAFVRATNFRPDEITLIPRFHPLGAAAPRVLITDRSGHVSYDRVGLVTKDSLAEVRAVLTRTPG
jgi:hypothetical protein